MRKPRFLVTGAAGYLGRRIVRDATTRGQVYAASHRAPLIALEGQTAVLDVTDRDAVLRLCDQLNPTVVIHTAAVNPGQGDDVTMQRVNVEGSRHVAEGAEAIGARLIAISTDVVHDGRSAPYADNAHANPLNHYGRSKADGEEAVLTMAPGASVVRTSLMYGLDEMDRGTAGFAKRLARGEPQVLFSDVLRNPILVDTLARAVIKLAELSHTGRLNIAGRQALSRDAYGRRMLRFWGMPTNHLVQSGRAADVSESIPRDLRLNVSRAQALLGFPLLGVDEVLANPSTDGSPHSD